MESDGDEGEGGIWRVRRDREGEDWRERRAEKT